MHATDGEPPHLTAIFATNDLLAIGAGQALISIGRKVPDDVSVIGITDIQLAHQVHPALTTVAIHTAAIAELSINSLIRLVQAPGAATVDDAGAAAGTRCTRIDGTAASTMTLIDRDSPRHFRRNAS